MRLKPKLRYLLAALTLVALGGMMNSADAATFVYVGNAESNDIGVFKLDLNTGDLAAIENVVIPRISKPGPTTPMAITPDKRYLHIATRSEPFTVSSFAIDRDTGKLNYIQKELLLYSMAYISTDRTGRYLFQASYPSHVLVVNPLNPEGYAFPAQQVAAGLPNAHAVLADPDNRFVLATSLGSDRIVVFPYDAKRGELSLNEMRSVSVKEKAGPRHFVFHPNGKLVFLLCELDATVYVFEYDAQNGALQQKQVISALQPGYTGKVWAADIHVTPDGKYLYASERGTSTLAAFSIAPEGTLTLIDFYPTEQQPRAFNIDPSGHYLLAVGQLSNSLTAYAIDAASGKLTKLKQYPMGKNPNWVEIIDLP